MTSGPLLAALGPAGANTYGGVYILGTTASATASCLTNWSWGSSQLVPGSGGPGLIATGLAATGQTALPSTAITLTGTTTPVLVAALAA